MDLLLTGLGPALHAIGWTLLHFLWQGALVGAVYAALRPWLPAGEVRYAAALVALALLVLAPLLTLSLLLGPAASLSSAGADAAGGLPTFVVRAADAAGSEAWALWLVAAWAAGVAVLTVRALLHWRSLLQLIGRGRALPQWEEVLARLHQRFGIARRVRLLWSEHVDTPTLIGWWRPVILLPAAVALGFPAAQVELILAHELGHVRRWDCMVNLLQVVVETILFYHPVVHWISRDLRREREICCDALVLRLSGGQARDYARTLADLEGLRVSAQRPLVLAASGGVLLDRVQRIAGIVPNTTLAPRTAGRLLPLGVAGLVLLAGVVQQRHWLAAQMQDMPLLLARLLAVGSLPPPRLSVADLVDAPDWRRLRARMALPPGDATTPAVAADTPLPLPARSLVVATPRLAAPATAVLDGAIELPAPRLSALSAKAAPLPVLQPVKVVQPVYPEAARESGLEGVVTLEFEVGSAGEVVSARVLSAQPERVFDAAALQALRWWRFAPATVHRGVHYQQNFLFTLGHARLPDLANTEEVSAETSCRITTGSRLCRRADGVEDAARAAGVDVVSVR